MTNKNVRLISPDLKVGVLRRFPISLSLPLFYVKGSVLANKVYKDVDNLFKTLYTRF